MLKQRLLDSGADAKLWFSQFGFRRSRSTLDAVFVARRRIEVAMANWGGRLSLLALDWRKAFDSVNVDALIFALRRFGIPPKLLRVISHSHAERFFVVRDGDTGRV